MSATQSIGDRIGGTVRLPRLVGRGRALELLLTGQMIDAQEAYRIGLVNRVVPADRLLGECEQVLRGILENGPLAVAACLEAVDSGSDVGLDDALLLEANLFGLLSGTADMREGTAAFMDKRSPRFRGGLKPAPSSRPRLSFHYNLAPFPPIFRGCQIGWLGCSFWACSWVATSGIG